MSLSPGRPREYHPIGLATFDSICRSGRFIPAIGGHAPFDLRGIPYRGSLLLLAPDDARWHQTGGRTIFRRLDPLEFHARMTAKGLVVVATSDLTRVKLAYNPVLAPLVRRRLTPWRRRRRRA